jgi:hypothetical protein
VQQRVVAKKPRDWEGFGGKGSGVVVWAFFKKE